MFIFIETTIDYNDYVKVLGEVDLNNTNSFDEILDAECSTGACPIK